MGGHPCQMEKILPWAKKKKLLVIEDCAETCGAIYKGRKLGTWSDISCFSFEEKKITVPVVNKLVDAKPVVSKDSKPTKKKRKKVKSNPTLDQA